MPGRADSTNSGSFGTLKRLPDTPPRPDEDEQEEENGVLFWTNKGGFPVNDHTWERMWKHVGKLHPDGEGKVSAPIRGVRDLPQVLVPRPPLTFALNTPISDRLHLVQKYMSELQYNHTGTQFFEILKNRPISGLMESAKEMIRESLPIKCLEAVILGIYLTNGMPGVERFPISFKSYFQGNAHRHVVLGIYYAGLYGALGMSRRDDLMYKPLVFKSLADLALDYESAYKKYWHELKKVKIGLPVPHDSHSYEQISWRYASLNVSHSSKEQICKTLDKCARDIRGRLGKPGTATSYFKSSIPPSTDYTSIIVKKEVAKSPVKVHSRTKKSNKHGNKSKNIHGSIDVKDRLSNSRKSSFDSFPDTKAVDNNQQPNSEPKTAESLTPDNTQSAQGASIDYQIRI